MSGYGCHVWNLSTGALSGFRRETDALSAGGRYLIPDGGGGLDATGLTGLCVVCENCGAIVESVHGTGELSCPDCGEREFRVFQTFRLITIKDGFAFRWHDQGRAVAIDVPARFRNGMLGIRYTVDGSEPTLASPAYAGPIPYAPAFRPIRAAVFYDDARSQIIEWDYGRAQENRERIRVSSQDPIPGESGIPSGRGRPDAPVPESAGGREKKEDGKGCACVIFLAMGIGGVALLCNDWPVSGCILLLMALLGVIGLAQDQGK